MKKVCNRCNEEKELLDFFRQKSGDGYKNQCKRCQMRYQEDYRNRKKATPDPELTQLLRNWR